MDNTKTKTITITQMSEVLHLVLQPRSRVESNVDKNSAFNSTQPTAIEKRIIKKANENLQLSLENSFKLGQKIGLLQESQNSLKKEIVVLKEQKKEQTVLHKEKMNTIAEECEEKLNTVKERMQWWIKKLKKEKEKLQDKKFWSDDKIEEKELKGRLCELGDLIHCLKLSYILDKVKLKEPPKKLSKKTKISTNKKKDKPFKALWKNSIPTVENFLKKHSKKVPELEKENTQSQQKLHSLQASIEKSEKQQQKQLLDYKTTIYKRISKCLSKDIKDLKWIKKEIRDEGKEAKRKIEDLEDLLEKAYNRGYHKQCKEDKRTLKLVTDDLKKFASAFKNRKKK